MDRRNFFKGMFGAAIIASMPKIVVDQIERTTPVQEVTQKETFSYQGQQRMFLYDDNKLIASSSEFNLLLRRELIDISHIRLDNPPYPEYRYGVPDWSVSARIYWNNHKEGLYYFAEEKPLQCVVYDKGLRIKGNVYITCCILSNGSLDYPYENVMLSGVGNLIVDVENE